MADQWDAFPDAGATATADDPFAKFPDVEQPKQSEVQPKSQASLSDAVNIALGGSQVAPESSVNGTGLRQTLQDALGSVMPLPAKALLGLEGMQHGRLHWPTDQEVETPLLSNESVQNFITKGLDDPLGAVRPEDAITGVLRGIGDVVSGASSPENISLLGVAPEGKLAQRLVAGSFLGQSLLGTPEQWQAFKAAPTTAEKTRIATAMGLGVALPAAGLAHAAFREAPKTLSETLAPVLGDTTAVEAAPPEVPATAPAAPESIIAPVSPETAAAPITPEGTRIEGPALVDTNGNVIIQGKLGDTHADLMKEAMAGPDAEKAIAAFENDAQHVFVDDQGNVLNRKQAAPVAAAAGQIPDGTTKVESQMLKAEPSPVQSFVTSKGSEYTVHEDGTTTRNKSVHPEHPGDEGVKPRSSETFYVTPEQALQLAEVQAQGQKTRLAKTADGEWGMQYTEGPNAGKFERRTVTRPSLQPAVGLQPVEVWYGQNKPHFGNEITEVRSGSTEKNSSAEPAPDESTTGVAQRVNEARTEAGRTGEILPGEGVSAEEMVNRGRELLKGGADPEAIITGVSEGKAVTGDEMAVLRARREELSRASDQAADELRKNPDDPALKQSAENAFKAETDFAQRIKPAATEWHKVGEAMQGETEVQTGTFTGLRRAFVERTGRDVTPKESVTLEKIADRVKKANTEVDQATSAFSEVVKKETETMLPKTAEELRNHFAEKFKKMLPCS